MKNTEEIENKLLEVTKAAFNDGCPVAGGDQSREKRGRRDYLLIPPPLFTRTFHPHLKNLPSNLGKKLYEKLSKDKSKKVSEHAVGNWEFS